MIRSMTGFATKTVSLTLDDGTKTNIAMSIKSLNSRFFEATCKMSYQLHTLETKIAKKLKKALHRGHVYYTLHIDNQNVFKGAIEPALSIIDGYIKAINVVQKKHNLEGTVSVHDVLQLPNAFTIQEKGLHEKITELVFATTDELIEQIITMQRKEGDVLSHDISQRIALMQKAILEIEQASAKLIETQKTKVSETIKELEADENKFAEMQKNAAYALLDKMDIHEEIVRFKSHLNSVRAHLESDTIEKGKRLDFTLQELGREINTIAAKCSDAHIGALAINVKVELEKAREQTQNIV